MTSSEFQSWGASGAALLQRIDITNFKAFKRLSLELKGRHLLVYGANGSGKSSLYWALYTFLQSARKSTDEVVKYFDSADPERLLNIHEDADVNPGEIAVALGDGNGGENKVYRISLNQHGTNNRPVILAGNLASDFITYRFFFGFSDFKNSEKFDIWPLFEKEILPFCVSVGGRSPLGLWNRIKSGEANPDGLDGPGGAKAYRDFATATVAFKNLLPSIIDSISTAAQSFYDEHFAVHDLAEVKLKLGVTTAASFTGTNKDNAKFTHPVVEFQIQVGGKIITRPQSYLNEAKLTQLALSVRFAASMVNLHDSPLKLLVLDDVLVSLDMSNRMKVVQILQSASFKDYQQIIMTHDQGLFNEMKRQIQNNDQWSFVTLTKKSTGDVKVKEERRPLEKAKAYFGENMLDEAAQHLRIAAEENVRNYRQVVLNQNVAEGFTPLSEHIKSVKSHFEARLLQKCSQSISRDRSLSFSDADKQSAEVICIFDDLGKMTERVLNPAAHWNEVPLYEQEVEKTIELIGRLEQMA
jgi:energy-coupling factor transporter ATP-binding protein EcfA2